MKLLMAETGLTVRLIYFPHQPAAPPNLPNTNPVASRNYVIRHKRSPSKLPVESICRVPDLVLSPRAAAAPQPRGGARSSSYPPLPLQRQLENWSKNQGGRHFSPWRSEAGGAGKAPGPLWLEGDAGAASRIVRPRFPILGVGYFVYSWDGWAVCIAGGHKDTDSKQVPSVTVRASWIFHREDAIPAFKSGHHRSHATSREIGPDAAAADRATPAALVKKIRGRPGGGVRKAIRELYVVNMETKHTKDGIIVCNSRVGRMTMVDMKISCGAGKPAIGRLAAAAAAVAASPVALGASYVRLRHRATS
ncbi:hypothetical protein S40288_11062 [Stachybotrys chartarum IBT 40288]|nr:hypothetical protein S40288_11062 [Stachybotrys chartarum IBT 40288]